MKKIGLFLVTFLVLLVCMPLVAQDNYYVTLEMSMSQADSVINKPGKKVICLWDGAEFVIPALKKSAFLNPDIPHIIIDVRNYREVGKTILAHYMAKYHAPQSFTTLDNNQTDGWGGDVSDQSIKWIINAVNRKKQGSYGSLKKIKF